MGWNYRRPLGFLTMIRTADILDVPISIVDMDSAVGEIRRWVRARDGHYVCAADVNSVMQARCNPAHRDALRAAAMVVPDGTPLIWTARSRGQRRMRRVPGPDLMLELCAAGLDLGWRHYFYGGAEGVAEDLAQQLTRRFPGLQIAGLQTPPFRRLSNDERNKSLADIAAADPHVLWVGLGCPKQEIWMHETAAQFPRTVIIGVGAAFNFHSNRIARAPLWMRRGGLEWLHRLASEPRRLWRRYLVSGPKFLLLAGMESLQMRFANLPSAPRVDEGS